MKIAFFTYPSAFQNVGGGEILLLKLKEYLEKKGVSVDFFDSWKGRIEHYDFLHVFGSVKDCLGLVRVARSRRVRVAITPLIWSDLRRAFFEPSLRLKGELLARHFLKALFPSFPSSRRKLLLHSDLVFPNSEMEKRHIARLFAVPLEKMHVVYNGVDESFSAADPSLFKQRFGDGPFILGVGRVEPRKNQLHLIRAVRQLDRRLVLIGSPVSGYETYFEACQREGAAFTTFVPTLSHEDPLLGSAYAACEVFVLQGWFETPGLAALEAALAGARVVATQGGSTREYFGDRVDYLNPASPGDIAEKIARNVRKPKDETLKRHVLSNFTWGKIADRTAGLYKEALGRY